MSNPASIEQALAEGVYERIQELNLDPSLPLIIADADEVLFQFMAALVDFIERNGMRFEWASYAITGNVRNAETDEVLDYPEVRTMLASFFAECADHLEAVPDAANVLSKLSKRAQVVVLSNVPEKAREARARCLQRNGLDYPLIANDGLKGPAVRELTRHAAAPAIFIDDIPHNHKSVAEAAEHVMRLQFIAHPRLRTLIGPAEHCHHRLDSWSEIEQMIDNHLKSFGY